MERIEGTQLQIKAPTASGERVRSILKADFPNLSKAKTADERRRDRFFFDPERKESSRAARLRRRPIARDHSQSHRPVRRQRADHPAPGATDILVQLPGIQDPERAKEIIGKTALLEFKLVDDNVNPEDAAKSGAPPGRAGALRPGRERRAGASAAKVPYVLEARTLMTGEYINDARVRPGEQLQGPYVELILNDQGARLFEQITAANVKRRLAIVLDNNVYSAPVIQERIGGGRASITGSFDIKEARDLSIVLRAGALPAPVEIVEERTVGPSLGRDSIKQGLTSFVVGGALVVLFMIAYYKGAGVVADVALVFNVLFMVADPRRFPSGVDAAGHRRHRAHPRHGGGCQRADQRAHSRGVTRRPSRTLGHRGGLSKCLAGDLGLQHHDLSFGRDFVPVRHRPDQRFRGDSLRRYLDHGVSPRCT